MILVNKHISHIGKLKIIPISKTKPKRESGVTI